MNESEDFRMDKISALVTFRGQENMKVEILFGGEEEGGGDRCFSRT
jgi:hypothetical protein